MSHKRGQAVSQRVDGHGKQQAGEGLDALTREATRLPARVPASAATVNAPSSRQSRLTPPPSRALSADALLTAMTSKEVPTAAGISKPRASTSAGTMTNPPPTPKKPVSSPTPVAAAATLMAWRAVTPPRRCRHAAALVPGRSAAAGLSSVTALVPPPGPGAAALPGGGPPEGSGWIAGAGLPAGARRRSIAAAAASMRTANRVSSRSGLTLADSLVPA